MTSALNTPSGWKELRLDEACEVILGQSPPGDTYNSAGNGLPFFQGKAEFGEMYPTPRKWCSSPGKLAEPEDILISVSAAAGHTNLCPSKACIGRGLAAIRPRDGMPSRYFLYAIRATVDALVDQATGSTFEAVSGADLKAHIVPVAPPPMQPVIVAEIEKQFTRLDAGIAALRNVQAKLKRYRAAVLKAASEGRLVPNEADTFKKFESGRDLLARIKTAQTATAEPRKRPAPNHHNNPNLLSLPAGWTWAGMREVGNVQLGRQRAPQHHNGDHMRPYLRVANVFEARIDTSDVKEMNFTPDEFLKYRLQAGDILLNEGQTPELVGRPAMFKDEIPGCCYQKTLLRFRAHPGVLPNFALTVFRAYMHSGRFKRSASITTNIAHLTAEKFVEIEFPLPPLAEQKRIVAEVERRLSVVEELEAVVSAILQRASRLRQSILQKVFAGELVD